MKRVTVRLSDPTYGSLRTELIEWRKVRGPKFSLNELCSEKLSQQIPVTQWIGTTGTLNSNTVITYPINFPTAPLGDKPCPTRKKKRKKKH
jgi:hypothetical protein